jgi:hypothetical protein
VKLAARVFRSQLWRTPRVVHVDTSLGIFSAAPRWVPADSGALATKFRGTWYCAIGQPEPLLVIEGSSAQVPRFVSWKLSGFTATFACLMDSKEIIIKYRPLATIIGWRLDPTFDAHEWDFSDALFALARTLNPEIQPPATWES